MMLNNIDSRKHKQLPRHEHRPLTAHRMLLLVALLVTMLDAASSTVVVRPASGRAQLVPGEPLTLECTTQSRENPEFRW